MKPRTYFTPDTLAFLAQLKDNNNREWFAANKQRYEASVKQPMLELIRDAQPAIGKISPRFGEGSMFRIYRDIRFSEDKSPYKTHASAYFAHTKSRQKVHVPGYYLHIEPSGSFAAGGVWHPDTPTLTFIRKYIVQQTAAWKKVRSTGLELEGDMLARSPHGFPEDHRYAEDLRRKDFVSSIEFSDQQVCDSAFLQDFVSACKSLSPLMKFLTLAVGLPW